ncbi:unnamed protein product [Acanthoscelides obtectus]|uniref:Uncharacterized protein n=1 Tax=Acanthoscelides obtectus TaxID=200917 RepID=A0A9P0PUZ2_ACAOB|nr:unnamed protein product [Acanthoscelides obtectus]CAK1627562.1 hypothetical protein AOBTE_LOCUS4661 [Acanthoscelides obtectus]
MAPTRKNEVDDSAQEVKLYIGIQITPPCGGERVSVFWNTVRKK